MPKILIVDDDKALATAMSVRLRSAGFETTAFDWSRVDGAVRLDYQPDLVLLRVAHPTNAELVFDECLKFSGNDRKIPVVFLSDCDSPPSRIAALRQGASEFIPQPYDSRQVLGSIRLAIASAG